MVKMITLLKSFQICSQSPDSFTHTYLCKFIYLFVYVYVFDYYSFIYFALAYSPISIKTEGGKRRKRRRKTQE